MLKINGKWKIIKLLKTIIKKILKRCGYEIKKIQVNDKDQFRTKYPYLENPETGGINLELKLERINSNGPFEWENILVLNDAVMSLVHEKNIAEIGCGTGYFAYMISKRKEVKIKATDLDKSVIEWARKNRSNENITYLNREFVPKDGPFEVVVAVEVIEHVHNYSNFIKRCISLAPKAIFTTPNKSRSVKNFYIQPPEYKHHVREWTAGEIFWVLRSFYEKVCLFSLDEKTYSESPHVFPINILSSDSPIIAVCELPYE